MHYGLCENGEWVSEKGNLCNFLHNIIVLRVQLVTQQTLQQRNKEIFLRENLVVADYQQCCGKSCMNLLPILSHLYRLCCSLQSKSTLLIDQFPRALLKKWKFFAPAQVVVRFCCFWSIWTNGYCSSWTY